MMRLRSCLWLFLMAALFALASCASKGPEPITCGKDNCTRCGMIMGDATFGAELVTGKGKVLKFDSVECLAGYVNKKGAQGGTLWAVDFSHPANLIDATKAFYIQSDSLHSPMGLGLAAFAEQREASAAQGRYAGKLLTWDEVLKYVRQRWS